MTPRPYFLSHFFSLQQNLITRKVGFWIDIMFMLEMIRCIVTQKSLDSHEIVIKNLTLPWRDRYLVALPRERGLNVTTKLGYGKS